MKKPVIVGGGTAGSIAAAALARQLGPQFYHVTVIESAHSGSIGVDERDFIQKTDASIKLGIQFRNWRGNKDSFFQHLPD